MSRKVLKASDLCTAANHSLGLFWCNILGCIVATKERIPISVHLHVSPATAGRYYCTSISG